MESGETAHTGLFLYSNIIRNGALAASPAHTRYENGAGSFIVVALMPFHGPFWGCGRVAGGGGVLALDADFVLFTLCPSGRRIG